MAAADDPAVLRVVHGALERGRALADYVPGLRVRGAGRMALLRNYSYVLSAPAGKDFAPEFSPALTPEEMLFLGVFEGKYLNDCVAEFPREWFLHAAAANRLSPRAPNVACNYFGVKSRQPLHVWRENGWLPRRGGGAASDAAGARAILADPVANPDERGWFQWYCRYWLGRRIPELDAVQIGRWRSFARHAGAVRKHCMRGDLKCRARERQALLQWAYNPFL